MTSRKIINSKLKEAVDSVLPITVIVAALCFFFLPVGSGLMLAFLVGAVLLIVGMGLFTLGAELSMTQMGNLIGAKMTKSRRLWLIVVLAFLLGLVITIAEPDLQVLAQNVPGIDKTVLILTVSAGVGIFLTICMLRILLGIPLRRLLLLFYGIQDIRQYKLHVRNQSLLDKNAAYQRVIDSTREFRHNMANMIYGLEGIILTHDMEKIERYYADMSRRCALINNENAVALNRLTDASLTALILRKLDVAEEKQILFYLNVDSNFSFDSLPSQRLCETMGNLMDNALEAAARSASPQVNLMLRSTPEYDEILLDNTYSKASDLSFLSGAAKSSKAGHQAVGLASVRRLLAKYPNACFNQYVQGRYIETSLCEYKRKLL